MGNPHDASSVGELGINDKGSLRCRGGEGSWRGRIGGAELRGGRP